MPSSNSLEPNNEGLKRIRSLISWQQDVERAKYAVNRSKAELENAENCLVEWLVPKDAEIGQVFMLAVRTVFLEVKVIGVELMEEGSGNTILDRGFEVSWRPHPPQEL